MTKATPKNVSTPMAPSRMSPTALAKPMMCTSIWSVWYLARTASSCLATAR